MLAGGGLGARSGGVGTLLDNLIRAWGDMPGAPAARVVDTRGQGGWGDGVRHFPTALWALMVWLATRPGAPVHAHMTTRGSCLRKAMLAALAMAGGAPVVMHLHGADFPDFCRRLPWPARVALGAVLRRAAAVLVLGPAWRTAVIAAFGLESARVHVLPNGVPAPAPRPAVRRPGPVRLLFLGRIGARKGVPTLLAALASPALRDRDLQATIAGDGDAVPYRAAAAAAGLSGRVAFPGWLDRAAAAALLADADLLVLPSYHEVLPMAVLEALAAGTPVIATPVGALPDYLTAGETALLVPPGDVPALAAAIGRLMDDAGLRRRLAAGGRVLFAAQFDVAATARRLATVYDGVAARRPMRRPWLLAASGRRPAAGGSG